MCVRACVYVCMYVCVCVCSLIKCPGYDIKLHLMVRLTSLSLRNVEYPFMAITPKSTLTGVRAPTPSVQ